MHVFLDGFGITMVFLVVIYFISRYRNRDALQQGVSTGFSGLVDRKLKIK
jgi:hypothetical protein